MLRMSLSAVLPWESGCVSCEPAALWPPIYSCVGCRSTCVMAWGASLDEAANNTGIAGVTCLYMYHLLILLRKCARSLIVLGKCMRKNASVCVCVCVCVCGAMWQEGLEGPLVPSGRERVADREIGA